jgi:hypothetical protein
VDSHGHPDHFHTQSLKLLNTRQKILLPDHYDPGIQHYLEKHGFPVEVLPYRTWKRLSPQIRVMCMDTHGSPHFSQHTKHCLKHRLLLDQFGELCHQRYELFLGHVGDQVIEHCSLPQQ